jgi:hypothetical protein
MCMEGKAIPVTGRGGPRDIEAPTFSRRATEPFDSFVNKSDFSSMILKLSQCTFRKIRVAA